MAKKRRNKKRQPIGTYASRKHGISIGATSEPVGLLVLPEVQPWHCEVPPWRGAPEPTWRPLPTIVVLGSETPPGQPPRLSRRAEQKAVTDGYRAHKRHWNAKIHEESQRAADQARSSEHERRRRLGVLRNSATA